MASILSHRTRRRFGFLSPVSLAWLATCTALATALLWTAAPPASRLSDTAPTVARVVPKPIERVTEGDTVLAYDFVTGQNVLRRVYEVHKSFTTCWVDIALGDGTSLTATRFHPFWVENEKAWIAAVDLHREMTVRVQDGRIMPIADIRVRILDKPEPTYNFEVENEHNYYAGRSPILVHNGPGPGYFEALDFIVYEWLNDGQKYIGMTRVDYQGRYGSMPPGWRVLHDGLTYEEARGLEQHYIDKFGLDNLANKKNGINPLRDDFRATRYREAADDLLNFQRNGTIQIPGC